MNSDNMKLQTAIGLFILTAIIITMLMVIYMTGGVRLDSNAYLVVVKIDNIGDLKVGAPAKFRGVNIGKVKQITIEDNCVRLVAGINSQYRLQEDTAARIATAGLVGDAFLEFLAGKSRKQLKYSQDLETAPCVPGITQSGMGDMLAQIQKIGGQVEDLVNNFNQLIGKKEFRDNIERSVANVNSITAELNSLLADFHKNLDQIDKAVGNVVKITDIAETTMKSVDGFVSKVLSDPKFADEIVAAVKNVSGITKVMADNKENIGLTMKNISATTGNIANITGNIQPGKGILRLLSDEQAGEEVMAVISSLQRVARCIATVGLSDLIADKLIGDKIAEKWLATHGKNNATEMAYQWKNWMAQQKAFTDSLSRPAVHGAGYMAMPLETQTQAGTVRRVPGETYSGAPADAGAYEQFFDPVTPVESQPAAPKVEVTPMMSGHPLEAYYNK